MPPSSNPQSRRRRRLRNHRDWPNLPNDLLLDILNRLRTLPDFYAFRAVCQNWRNVASSHPPNLSPLLLLNVGNSAALFDISTNRSLRLRLPFKALAFSHRHLVSVDSQYSPRGPIKSFIILTNLFTLKQTFLPDHPNPFQQIMLSAHPGDPECRVVLFDRGMVRFDPQCVVQCLQLGNRRWSVVPSSHNNLMIYDMMFYRGELITLTDRETSNFELELHVVDRSFAVRKYGVVGRFERIHNAWLAELDGAMFVVVQITVNILGSGEMFLVFRLDEEEEWEEVEDLGDKALFVSGDGNAVFASAGGLGLRGNCVYSINSHNADRAAGWFEFCLEDRSSRNVMIDDANWPHSDSAVWVFP